MPGKRKLDKDAMYLFVFVVFIDKPEQVSLGQVPGLAVLDRIESKLMRSFLFRGYVADRCGILAYQDSNQSRNNTMTFFNLSNFLLKLLSYLGCYFCAVDDFCRHAGLLIFEVGKICFCFSISSL